VNAYMAIYYLFISANFDENVKSFRKSMKGVFEDSEPIYID